MHKITMSLLVVVVMKNECVVRNVSPQVALAPMEDLKINRRKKILKWRWKTVKQWFCKS